MPADWFVLIVVNWIRLMLVSVPIWALAITTVVTLRFVASPEPNTSEPADRFSVTARPALVIEAIFI